MENLDKLANLLISSKSAVFFGGAGVSTESGIPDFRSENGINKAKQTYGYRPEVLLSRSFFDVHPEVFFRYCKENLIINDVQPNSAHIALAELEQLGKLAGVVTQNIDGLHQAAGSKVVYELHGAIRKQYCMVCSERYSLDYIFDPANCKNGIIPICQKCNGIVRPDIVLYEEELDNMVIGGAITAISKADLLIVGGTSLAVYPAAGLLRYFTGQNLVVINKTATSADNMASLVIHGAIGAVFNKVMEKINSDT